MEVERGNCGSALRCKDWATCHGSRLLNEATRGQEGPRS